MDSPLIDRYVSGECSPDEADRVLRWVGTDPDRRELIERAQMVWGAAHRLPGKWNVDEAWERARLSLHAISSIAQGTGALGQTGPRLNRLRQKHAVDHPLRRPRLYMSRVTRIAVAACVTVAVLGVAWRQLLIGRGSAASAESISTGPRQRATMQLRDGSRVVLAPNSRLVESPGFGTGTREIELEGAAYFDVVHDPSRPFLVITHDLRIRDVGTRFAVDAYAGPAAASDTVAKRTESRVAVTDGSVEIEVAPSRLPAETETRPLPARHRILVAAGHVGRVDARGQITVDRPADINQYISWTTNDLTFDDVPVGEAIPRIERWYGVRVELGDPGLVCRHITATFHDEALNQVLDELGLVLHVRRVWSGESVTLEPSDMHAHRSEHPAPPSGGPSGCAAGIHAEHGNPD